MTSHNNPSLINVLDELPFWSAPFGVRLLAKVVPKRNMSLLDIGFGTGFPLTELAMRFGDSCTIYGIDPWKEAAERVREKLRIYGITNVRLFIGKAEEIPLENQSIDLITSNNGLNNVTDLSRVLSECARVLKPGGKLIFTMNTDETMVEFYEVLEQSLSEHDLPESVVHLNQHIYEKRKPLGEIKSLLAGAGFDNVTLEENWFDYKFADGSTMLNHFFIRLAFLDSWKEIVPEKDRDLIFSEVERRLNHIVTEKGHLSLRVPFVVIEARRRSD